MNWNKNIPHLIQAATLAKTPLVIVSKSFVQDQQQIYNPWKDSLYEAKKLTNNNPYVIGIGKLTQDELVGFYQSAQALVFPSYYEGFGLPVVEAFAAGCPVITTKCGSLAEVGVDAVSYVDPDDVNSISLAMKKLTNEDVRTNLIHKGKQRVRLFTWKKPLNKQMQFIV